MKWLVLLTKASCPSMFMWLTNGRGSLYIGEFVAKVVDGAMSKNLMGIIAKINVDYGGLTETKMTNKLVCFGVDGTTFF